MPTKVLKNRSSYIQNKDGIKIRIYDPAGGSRDRIIDPNDLMYYRDYYLRKGLKLRKL